MRPYDIRFEPEDVVVQDWLDMYPVRFVYYDGEWWAVLKDVCDALGVQVKHTSYRIDAYDLLLADIPASEVESLDHRSRGRNPYREMYIVNQGGILDVVGSSYKDGVVRVWYVPINLETFDENAITIADMITNLKK